MKIKVKRFDTSLPLPAYKTDGAAALDMYAREVVTIPPHTVGYIPLNVAVEVPHDCWLMVAPRSSAHKLGIMMANGIAIGDSDFCGDKDEWIYPALNFTDHEVVVEKGTRIAQMMVVRLERADIEEVDHLEGKDRGGFGTTGLK